VQFTAHNETAEIDYVIEGVVGQYVFHRGFVNLTNCGTLWGHG
jgi:hypothetical protein